MSISKPVLVAALLATLGTAIAPGAFAQTPPSFEPTTPAFPEPGVRRWQTGLARADRLQHTMFSLSAGLMIGLTSEEPAAAAGGAMALGVVKEVWDLRSTKRDPNDRRFDVLDLLADAIGAAGAYGLTNTLTR